jgi:drug/metabolite transporter (DMT)-like permease
VKNEGIKGGEVSNTAEKASDEESQYETGNELLGITLKVASVGFLVSMSAMIKLVGDGIPVGQIVFFRAFFAILPVVVYLGYRGQLGQAYYTKRPLAHLGRSIVGCFGMGLGFYGLTKLPLPDVVALRHATPLFAVIFAAILLGERVRLYRWAAVAMGMCGVLIISWPRITLFDSVGNVDEYHGVIATILSTIFAAVATIFVRALVKTEKSPTIVIYFSSMASFFAAMTYFFGWVPLDLYNATLLVSCGIIGGIGQILMTECYRHASVSVIAPFDYTSILFGIALSYILFGDLPQSQMLIGTAIVAAAGIFIIFREHRLGLPRKESRRQTGSQT